MIPEWLFPDLSFHAQALLRACYGLLLLGTLLQALPQAARFFVSERWGGYVQSEPRVDALHNPQIYPFVFAVWIACAGLIALGWWTPVAAAVNLVICRHLFIRMRWKSVLRGMGAPGFMAYWLGVVVFLLEYTGRYGSSLRPLALLVAQVDLAFIMLSAGVYKLRAGYAQNQGMDLGMTNPQWGYWWRSYVRWRPDHWLFKTLNHLAWSTEVFMALLMLVPQTRLFGGLLLTGSFAFIATQIRLGLLCEMVMTCGLLYVPAGSLVDGWIATIASSTPPAVAAPNVAIAVFNALLRTTLIGYLVLLPLAHGGLSYNLYGGRSLPRPLQWMLERYTNFFGLIVWRVFSVDLVNFFVQIYQEHRQTGQRVLVSQYGSWSDLRYSHVAESITVTSLFTTLKYYVSNQALFETRLLRYARTMPCPREAVLVFEYIRIEKSASRFEFVPAIEFRVDLVAGTISRQILNDAVSVHAADPVSPIREGAVPGSYAPLKH